jgi:hypothetical protein
MQNWNKFIKECSENILPIYQKHENTFDMVGVHGRLHIARSIIFSEFMARYFYKLGKNIDFNAIRYAVSFHDSGRQANGIDRWEMDSTKNCFTYLSTTYDKNYCNYVSSLINKDKSSDINKNVVYDADVLEIMRPCCGHGERDGFRSNFLLFMKDVEEYQDIRNYLIEDAWKLIEYTEDNKQLFKDNNHLYRLIDIVNSGDFDILNKFQL